MDIKVKIANKILQPVRVTIGFRQGESLPLVWFNLVLEKVIREMNVSEEITLDQNINRTLNICKRYHSLRIWYRSNKTFGGKNS